MMLKINKNKNIKNLNRLLLIIVILLIFYFIKLSKTQSFPIESAPIYSPETFKIIKKNKENKKYISSNKYIISLTTIPSKINYIERTIKSLIEQTLKPEKIILNIPKKYNFVISSLFC